MRALNKVIDWCILALAAIAGAVLLFLLLAVCFATVSRALFNEPFSFLIDYAAYSLLYIAFLGSPWLLSKRGHINIDMVVNALTPKVKRIWQAILDLILALVAAVLCVIGFQLTRSNFINGVTISDFLGTPQWLLLVCIPVGSFFTAVEAVRLGIRTLADKPVPDEGKEARA